MVKVVKQLYAIECIRLYCVAMGVKMCWIQIKMGHPLTRNGASLAPFRAIGAHPSNYSWSSLICVYV